MVTGMPRRRVVSVLGSETGPVNPDPAVGLAPAPARKRYVDDRGPRRKHLPQLSRRAVAEDGSLAAREDSRHPPALAAHPGVADRVDAAVDAVEAT